jgi:hypothetical protein
MTPDPELYAAGREDALAGRPPTTEAHQLSKAYREGYRSGATNAYPLTRPWHEMASDDDDARRDARHEAMRDGL